VVNVLKLSHEQLRLLFWLSLQSTVFEISREDVFIVDKYSGLHRYKDNQGNTYKFDIRTLQVLERNELIRGQSVYHYGVLWERYTLTEKGQVLTLLLSAADNFYV
jgi:hypothetical protein